MTVAALAADGTVAFLGVLALLVLRDDRACRNAHEFWRMVKDRSRAEHGRSPARPRRQEAGRVTVTLVVLPRSPELPEPRPEVEQVRSASTAS